MSIRCTATKDLRQQLLNTIAIEPWDLVSLRFLSISFTSCRSLKQSLTFHRDERAMLNNTLRLIPQCLVSPLDSGTSLFRVRKRQTILYIWRWCLMPTTHSRLFEATSGTILAKAVHELSFVPETLMCVFTLSNLYTR